MNRAKLVIIALCALLVLIPSAAGQDQGGLIEPADMDMTNPAAHISFPPPVYVVRDSVDIRGTALLADMRNFFIEIRPLDLDVMADEEEAAARQWFPVTSPRIEGVEDDVLGTWNTVTLRDGLYELRLRINMADGTQQYARVSPLRVEKEPPPFVSELMVAAEQVEAVVEEPTPEPEPTATEDPSPRAIATVNSNVRSGDSTLYPVIGALMDGDSAAIRGISSRNTGWFYIELANGRSGFIFPGIVNTAGDLSNLPRINPPPLPPTPIPLPTAVPVAAPQQQTGANLIMENVRVDPHPPRCNEAYRINVTVRNNGSGASTSGGEIEVRDSRPDGSGLATTRIGFGALQPGQAQEIFGHLTQAQYYNETHNVNLYLDINNQVAETNEGDNHHADAPYILQRANC